MATLAFEPAEFRYRVQQVQSRMAQAGIDVLLISDPANINYVSGYDAYSYYTHQVLAVALDAAEPIWIGRKMDVACARYTAFMQAENLVGYPETFIGTERHPMDFIAHVIRERGWSQHRIGMEMDTAPLTPRCMERLRAALPDASWVDAERLVNWLRLVKSPREIAYMREAAKLSERAMEAAIGLIASGVRQCEVAAAIHTALIAGQPEYAGHLTMNGVSMPSGARTSAPHLSWTSGRFKTAEATNIELGGCRHGYHAGLSRTVFIGEPDAQLRACEALAVEGLNGALEQARPGVACEEIAERWNQRLRRAGFEKDSRIGYSIGIGYPPHSWIDRTASLQVGDTTVLQPNMTFHLILGMWMQGWGFILSETFRVTDGAPEVFASFPRKLFLAS